MGKVWCPFLWSWCAGRNLIELLIGLITIGVLVIHLKVMANRGLRRYCHLFSLVEWLKLDRDSFMRAWCELWWLKLSHIHCLNTFYLIRNKSCKKKHSRISRCELALSSKHNVPWSDFLRLTPSIRWHDELLEFNMHIPCWTLPILRPLIVLPNILCGMMREQLNWSDVSTTTYKLAEECININYYGAKRMVGALIGLLQLLDSPRIVNVSSSGGMLAVRSVKVHYSKVISR